MLKISARHSNAIHMIFFITVHLSGLTEEEEETPVPIPVVSDSMGGTSPHTQQEPFNAI
jgi:hypothetical protein